MINHRVVFTPSGLNGNFEDGVTVLDAARTLGVDLDSVCGGRGICGRCQVAPILGSFAKWNIEARIAGLSSKGETEINYRAKRALESGNRLGCAARICGDVVIDVPASSNVHRQIVRKDLDLKPILVDPIFSLLFITLESIELGQSTNASEAIIAAVVTQHHRSPPTIAGRVLKDVHGTLAKGEATIIIGATIHNDEILAIWPGFVDSIYGVAIDVGSTTIAGHLCELMTGEIIGSAGVMNPQIRFGEDLMSRVSYVMMNPNGDRELTAAVRHAINDLIGTLAAKADVATSRIVEIVLVGNPIMHHILLGIDPTPLGQAPFVLATDKSVSGWASELEIELPNARFYVGPCIAGHVGADAAAAVLAEGPHRQSGVQLLVDIGTNAEIVLGNSSRLFAASSPTGPAFEGAQITAGQRATAGAIEHLRIDRDTLEPRFKVIGSSYWSDQPEFESSIKDIAITGICGSGIIEIVAEMFLSGIIDQDGVIGGPSQSPRIVPDGRTFSYLFYEKGATRLLVTQNDIRAIQLAKAALRAGIDLLIEHAGGPHLEEIRLAGAFGSHIDPIYAMVLGLIPDCPIGGVKSVGNAAGAGAVQALLSRQLRTEMEQTASFVTKIETATEPRFQELFVAAMAFPHNTAPCPNLSKEIQLPDRKMASASHRRRRASE